MHQQINLFQPMFRQERKLFSAKAVFLASAIIVTTLLAIYGYGSWKVSHLANNVKIVREQQALQENIVGAAGQLRASRSNTSAIDANIRKLSEDLAQRTRILDLLRNGAVGQSVGFAGRLEALARRHIQGLWLEKIVLSGTQSSMSLMGRALDAEVVPRYLQNLSSEPALSGARFEEFSIERVGTTKHSDEPVRFLASSVSLSGATEESRP